MKDGFKRFYLFSSNCVWSIFGGMIEDYKQESQNNFKSKIDYIKNSEVLNSIDTLVTYRDSVLLIFK